VVCTYASVELGWELIHIDVGRFGIRTNIATRTICDHCGARNAAISPLPPVLTHAEALIASPPVVTLQPGSPQMLQAWEPVNYRAHAKVPGSNRT